MERTSLYRMLTILALFAAALSGCAAVEKCPPSSDERPACTEVPACSRNRVFVFLLAGFDPLDGMGVLRAGLIEHGFIKVYCAPRPHWRHYVKEIRRLHEADADARFVIVAQGGACVTARSVAAYADAPIDVMVLLDRTGHGPAHAERVVFLCGEKGEADDDRVAEHTIRLSDAGCDTAKHPQTAALVAELLCGVAAKIPVVEVGPKCELADCPPCGNGWDFLRPDGHDSGCVPCKPMGLANAAPPATMQPAPEPDRQPLPKAEKKGPPAAPVLPKPTPANKALVLPPPPTRLPSPGP